MSRRRASVARWLVLGGLSALIPLRASAHPLHTSYVQLTFEADTGSLVASVRVFADDFLRHVGGGPATGRDLPAASAERRAASYLAQTFAVTDARGRAVPLAWCGWKRSGDMMILCLRGDVSGGLAGARVRDAVLMDLFSDQINVLQTTYRSVRHSVLFTRGESTKQLQ